MLAICLFSFCVNGAFAQDKITVRDYVQVNAIASAGDYSPFWLVTNRDGLSSLDKFNGYVRYGAAIDGLMGKGGNWGYSAGLDLKTG